MTEKRARYEFRCPDCGNRQGVYLRSAEVWCPCRLRNGGRSRNKTYARMKLVEVG